MKCEKSGHERCSFNVVEAYPSRFDILDEIDPESMVVYGTSDPTINPAEVWFTAAIAERYRTAWGFFNYPLDARWVRQDVEEIFGPHGFAHADSPFRALGEMRLPSELLDRFTPMEFLVALQEDREILDMPLGEIADLVRYYRGIIGGAQNFCVLNVLDGAEHPKQVFCSEKERTYREGYAKMTIRDILSRRAEKLGGSVIYFLNGYYTARYKRVSLFPHNTHGEVWGAFAAGAFLGGERVRVYPIGGLDLMTSEQWKLYQETQRWRKAPASVIGALRDDPFHDRLYRALIEERQYCAVSFDAEERRFRFELGTP